LIFGIIYLLVGILDLIPGVNTMFGLFPFTGTTSGCTR
jgi:hypothetical protein